jgi:hypothetical protein
VVSDDTQLIQIEKNTFISIFKEHKIEYWDSILPYLRDCLFLRGISEETKEKLVYKSSIKNFSTNTLISRQGDTCQKLMIIKRGKVQALRSVKKCDLKNRAQFRSQYKSLFEKMPSEMILEVDVIIEKNHVNEYEMINGLPMKNSLVAG